MENKLEYAITEEETRIADRSVALAVEAGASAVQVTLDKARTEIYALLDGELDNIRQTGDRGPGRIPRRGASSHPAPPR